MAQVIWAPAALQDARAIAEFIARDSVDQAALFVTRLIQATDRLVDFPQSGRIVPKIANASCHEIICGAYRIMYRLEGEEVWITGIVHADQDWSPE